MITKFSVVYVGLHGTPAAERRYPSERLAEAFQTAMEVAQHPGLEHLMIHGAEGMPPEEFKEQLSWFARDVMPAFAGRR